MLQGIARSRSGRPVSVPELSPVQFRAYVPGSPGDAMCAGAWGTSFWIDPKERLVGILMAQRPSTFPSRRAARCVQDSAPAGHATSPTKPSHVLFVGQMTAHLHRVVQHAQNVDKTRFGDPSQQEVSRP